MVLKCKTVNDFECYLRRSCAEFDENKQKSKKFEWKSAVHQSFTRVGFGVVEGDFREESKVKEVNDKKSFFGEIYNNL